MHKIKIRKAKNTDSKKIIELIIELAKFEKLKQPDIAAANRLIKDAFSNKPPFVLLLAEEKDSIVGYAIYYFTYSSFLAKKSLYLEDIYITDNYRSRGIGKLFFKDLLKIAKKNKCGRVEWIVLDWNKKAIDFYNKMGAVYLDNWMTYRISL